MRALTELISARVEFANLKTTDIVARNQAFKKLADRPEEDPSLLIRRIAFVLPRLSARLPWRSDCLVQAIAAQNWLASYDLYGQIQVGVEHPGAGQFGAHAWVLHRNTIVTGGQINRYSVLLDDSHRFEPTESDKGGRGGE
ncbi:MAG: lasso peptide biosynthesis B2 protein [Pseudomonadota bacterium]